MLEGTCPIFICHHGFPVATGPDNPEVDVNTTSSITPSKLLICSGFLLRHRIATAKFPS